MRRGPWTHNPLNPPYYNTPSLPNISTSSSPKNKIWGPQNLYSPRFSRSVGSLQSLQPLKSLAHGLFDNTCFPRDHFFRTPCNGHSALKKREPRRFTSFSFSLAGHFFEDSSGTLVKRSRSKQVTKMSALPGELGQTGQSS